MYKNAIFGCNSLYERENGRRRGWRWGARNNGICRLFVCCACMSLYNTNYIRQAVASSCTFTSNFAYAVAAAAAAIRPRVSVCLLQDL